MSNTSNTRIKLLITAYSPLGIASSEFGKLSVTLALDSETFPIELVIGIPIYIIKNMTWETSNVIATEVVCIRMKKGLGVGFWKMKQETRENLTEQVNIDMSPYYIFKQARGTFRYLAFSWSLGNILIVGL